MSGLSGHVCNACSLDYETLVILSVWLAGLRQQRDGTVLPFPAAIALPARSSGNPATLASQGERDSFHPLLPFLIANNGFIQTAAAHWASAEGKEGFARVY